MKKTKDQISYNMSRIKSKNSDIERTLRHALWNAGIRYRKNDSSVFGKPDIVFRKKKVAVFCDSEFWHGFDWENKQKEFKTNQQFWIPKIERNIQRDKEVTEKLSEDGWTVLRFWGKDIKKNTEECVAVVKKAVDKK